MTTRSIGSATYQRRRLALAKVAKFIVDGFGKGLLRVESETQREMLRRGFSEDVEHFSSEPDPVFANMRSLRIAESELFIYLNEGLDPLVDYVWKRIKDEGLPFERRDVIHDVLKRGRIKDEEERDVVIDRFDDFETKVQQKLSSFLGEFEERALRNAKRARARRTPSATRAKGKGPRGPSKKK